MNFVSVNAREVSKSWLLSLARGIIFLLFAVMIVGWPAITVRTLGELFAFFIATDGVLALFTGWISRHGGLMAYGVVSLLLGVYALFPIPNLDLFYWAVIAVWAVVRGFFEINLGVIIHRTENDWWLIKWSYILSGVVAMSFGLLLTHQPVTELLGFIWALFAFGLISGCLWIVIALNSHDVRQRLQHRPLKSHH